MKVVMPALKGLQKGLQVSYVDIGSLAKAARAKAETAGRRWPRALSGRKAGKTRVARFDFAICPMMPKVIGGIVGGAHNLDLKLLQERRARSVLRKQRIGALPDFRRRGFIQNNSVMPKYRCNSRWVQW